jgi:hypothetical protein
MNALQWGIIIIAPIAFGAFIWATLGLMKEAQKEWNTLYVLEKRAKEVKTKEEIEILHKELLEVKITNPHIRPRLAHMDGYLRGLYVQFKEE